ncbi:MAG: rRNA maturation RNase YbeY [Steroidobacteraceae bacterium]
MSRADSKDGPLVSLRTQVRSGWTPAPRLLRHWVGAALGARAAHQEVAVLIVGPAAMRRLNHQWRGKDKPTNVLSFPAQLPAGLPVGSLSANAEAAALGDLVLCPQVLRREAREQHKRERDHWAHLVVHGTLHLLGHDHEEPEEARRMERREVRVLRQLGIANPYLISHAA